MYKSVFLGALVLSSVFVYSYSQLDLFPVGTAEGVRVQHDKWTCSDCGDENPFWYSLCGGCGRFYW